jgi:hypothetical protein
MAELRVIESEKSSRRRRFALRAALGAVTSFLIKAWQTAFPVKWPTEPGEPPPHAKASALQDGALLSEEVDVVSRKHIA